MTTDLEVAHGSLRVTEADLDAAAEGFGAADAFVAGYFVVAPGGRFLTQASDLVAGIREQLGSHYRDLGTTLDQAVGALEGIWHQYEVTDGQARLDFERAQRRYLDGTGPPPLTRPPAPITPHPQRPPAARSIDLASLRAPLANPQADTRVLDALETWHQIKQGIDEVLSFGWVVGPLQHVGLHVPLDRFRDWMEGDYQSMAQAAAGLFALSDTFDRMYDGTRGTTAQLVDHWTGRSSDAVQTWVTRLGGGTGLHARDLSNNADALQTQAEVLKMSVDDVLDLLGDLADCLPIIEMYGDSLVEKGVHLAAGLMGELLEAVSVAARTVVKTAIRIQYVVDAVELYLAFIVAAGHQLRFPEVTTPQAPR